MQDSDKILSRLINILKQLSDNKRPKVKELAQQFCVTERTIQRDLYQRLLYFPIEKNENNELKFINEFSIEQSFLDDDEMFVTYLALSKIKDENPHFEEKIQKILKKLLKPHHKSTHMIDDSKAQNRNIHVSNFISTIQEGIIKNNILIVEFEDHSIEIKAHRVIENKNSWILLAHDISDKKTKVIYLNNVKNIYKQKKKFKTKKSFDEIVNNTHSDFFTTYEIKEFEVRVNKDIAQHFLHNKILPSQEILQFHKDGSLTLKFCAENENEVQSIISNWLPHLTITKPKMYNKMIIDKMQAYINTCLD